ncbi:metallopeptidase TldD-related protein [Pyxidicoccus xibeiensis]|uniref:metallopeptidase TldD-related protein n=1 Tax=Pyxidicoccus xibeiensis TaxID=2906759 RepID=UPI0020A7D28C|nr:metallopeptidase TldD-related protein [Pyxidicoccus xibeiensis]MCP3138664.1 metallopeptidase TldD-related protein [Pyxidicoccus xibeiensis]
MGATRDSGSGEGQAAQAILSGPRALSGAARAALEDFGRQHTHSDAELFLSASQRLTLEYEPGTRTSAASHGLAVSAAARVWAGERYGFAAGPVGATPDLRRLLELAQGRAAAGAAGASLPPPPVPAPAGPSPSGLPDLSVHAARQQAERLAREVVPPGVIVQALVLTWRATESALLRSGGGETAQVEVGGEAFLRCETARGAVVDAVALPPGEADADLAPLRARLAEAVSALEGPAEAADLTLPLVLRPAVAAPLVAGLSWLLQGDVAAATPALARAVGRKVFPSVLSVDDDPVRPRGVSSRLFDDEGRTVRALRLVDEGRLLGFLHSGETAARLGAEPNGRGLRDGAAPPAPSALGFFVVPRGDALPAHYMELVARVETFTTMPRPGRVCLIAGGWEVRDGQRVRRVAPVELDLPVLETFRALLGVGADLTFFPTAGGCGAPSLLLPPRAS